MGFLDRFRRLVSAPDTGRDVDELARRLGMTAADLLAFRPAYREFTVPKRSGGARLIAAPEPPLKDLQRRILHRLLARLKVHPAAIGFERGRSIVTNANYHLGAAVVVRMDIKDFFANTSAKRVRRYFRAIGWNGAASDLLTRLVTKDGGLPQGAPTSPRLSNLVNRLLDRRLDGLSRKFGAIYTRYADDITFSFEQDRRDAVQAVISHTKRIVRDEGYDLHQRRKLHVRRGHDRQIVTGLVVNERVNLPRTVRRRLRAVEHHLAFGRPATLTAAQLAGWRALAAMIEKQRRA